MAGFWENDQVFQPKDSGGFWNNDAVVSEKPKGHQYNVLPVSEDEKGNPHLDFNAGIFGPVKRAYDYFSKTVSGQEPFDPTSPEAIQHSMNIAGAVSPISAAAKFARPGVVNTPTTEQLYNKADEQFDNARGMGVDYSTKHIQALSKVLQEQMAADGIDVSNAPKTLDLLSKLQTPDIVGGMASTPQDTVIPISRLLSDRSKLSKTARDTAGTTEANAASRALEGIQTFIANNPKGAAIRGPAEEAAKVASDARGNYAAASRADGLDTLAYEADLNAGGANSGMNVDNAIRQQAKVLLKSGKKRAGFSDEEISALEDIVKGTPSRNAVRMAGNFLGGGGGIGSLFAGSVGAGIGGMIAGPTGAAIGAGAMPIAGMGAKSLGGLLTKRALNQVDDMVRQRSPLHRSNLNQTPDIQLNPMYRSLLMRGLLYDQSPDET